MPVTVMTVIVMRLVVMMKEGDGVGVVNVCV